MTPTGSIPLGGSAHWSRSRSRSAAAAARARRCCGTRTRVRRPRRHPGTGGDAGRDRRLGQCAARRPSRRGRALLRRPQCVLPRFRPAAAAAQLRRGRGGQRGAAVRSDVHLGAAAGPLHRRPVPALESGRPRRCRRLRLGHRRYRADQLPDPGRADRRLAAGADEPGDNGTPKGPSSPSSPPSPPTPQTRRIPARSPERSEDLPYR